jgi:hypothetical protein
LTISLLLLERIAQGVRHGSAGEPARGVQLSSVICAAVGARELFSSREAIADDMTEG